MSAIQPMDVATPHSALQVPVSTASSDAESGHPFAEVMRSAVSSPQMTQTAQKSSNLSSPSASSRPQFSHSSISAGVESKRADVSASNSSTPDVNGKSTTPGDLEGEAVESSVSMSSSADPNGVVASPVDGKAQSPILIAAGDRSSGITLQQGRTTAAQTATSPSDAARKQTSTAKKANTGENTSASSAIATATTTVRASVSAIVPNLPDLNLSAAVPKGSIAAIESTKPIDARAPDKNSSSSASSATMSGVAAHIPQADGATAMAGIMQHPPSISTDAMAASHNPVPLHGTQAVDGGSSAPSNSDATLTGESKGDGEASRPTWSVMEPRRRLGRMDRQTLRATRVQIVPSAPVDLAIRFPPETMRSVLPAMDRQLPFMAAMVRNAAISLPRCRRPQRLRKIFRIRM